MLTSVRLGVLVCAITVLGACMSSRMPGDPGPTRTGRTDAPPLPYPKGGKLCPTARPGDAAKDSRFEAQWERIDAEYEQGLRDILAEGTTSTTDALASLEKDVLKPRGWSLTSYLVRVLRELQSNSMREAGVEIGQETYAEASLRDATWDGYNAWDIVQNVRGETLQIFVSIEKTRTTDSAKARDAQRVADGLIHAARTAEPWVFTGCRKPPPPRDPVTLMPDDAGGTPTSRTEQPQEPHPRGAVAARPCLLIAPAVAAVRRSRYEREWQAVEKRLEPSLRAIVNEGVTSKEALASLDNDVLKPHKWSLSRYLVRVIHELQADSVQEASVEIGHEAYSEATLRDAHWDGYNAWNVVEGVRAETLEILLSLENARTTENPKAQDAQRVADKLMQVAKTAEPWVFEGGCRQPNDPPPYTPLTAKPLGITQTS